MFGVLCLVISLATYITSKNFWDRAIQTNAEVIRLKNTTSSSNEVPSGYLPVFEFETNRGEKIISSPTFRDHDKLYKVGDIVSLYYDPGTPKEVRIEKLITKPIGAFLPSIAGALICMLGFYMYLKA